MNYANHYGYSDVNPFEVVKVISDKTIEVREMDSEKDPSWVPNWHVGGFAGHCSNQQEQKWFIKSNAENHWFASVWARTAGKTSMAASST